MRTSPAHTSTTWMTWIRSLIRSCCSKVTSLPTGGRSLRVPCVQCLGTPNLRVHIVRQLLRPRLALCSHRMVRSLRCTPPCCGRTVVVVAVSSGPGRGRAGGGGGLHGTDTLRQQTVHARNRLLGSTTDIPTRDSQLDASKEGTLECRAHVAHGFYAWVDVRSISEASPSHELALQKLLPLLSCPLKGGVVSRGCSALQTVHTAYTAHCTIRTLYLDNAHCALGTVRSAPCTLHTMHSIRRTMRAQRIRFTTTILVVISCTLVSFPHQSFPSPLLW